MARPQDSRTSFKQGNKLSKLNKSQTLKKHLLSPVEKQRQQHVLL